MVSLMERSAYPSKVKEIEQAGQEKRSLVHRSGQASTRFEERIGRPVVSELLHANYPHEPIPVLWGNVSRQTPWVECLLPEGHDSHDSNHNDTKAQPHSNSPARDAQDRCHDLRSQEW
jgi:hypothetical protein